MLVMNATSVTLDFSRVQQCRRLYTYLHQFYLALFLSFKNREIAVVFAKYFL